MAGAGRRGMHRLQDPRGDKCSCYSNSDGHSAFPDFHNHSLPDNNSIGNSPATPPNYHKSDYLRLGSAANER
jgi:hypothetical protein